MYFKGLVSLGHGQYLVSRVQATQFAEGTKQPLTGPAVKLQFLLVVLGASQNLR